MRIMSTKIAMMTGFAFSLGVMVGVLFHLPGTTSPSTNRTGIGPGKYASSRVFNALRERLSSPDSELVSLAEGPRSPNNARRRTEPSAGILDIAVQESRIAVSWEDRTHTDYNDRDFIHSGNNRRTNSSDPSDSAVIAYHNRNIGVSLFKGADTTTTELDGKGDNQHVRSRIISVLQDIEVVQIERNHLLKDITQRRLKSGLDGLTDKDIGHPRNLQNNRDVNVESRMSDDNSSNNSYRKAGKVTPIANTDENNTASRNGLGSRSRNVLPADDQTPGQIQQRKDDIGVKPVDIVTGAFWSEELENLCPKGFTQPVYQSWRQRINGVNVVGIEEGCGRMQNRRLTFQDGSTACARYRPNTDQIQGEIYSYYLSRLLNINNVPPSAMLSVHSGDKVWANVEQEIAMSQWGNDKLIVLTKWIDGLEPAYIPTELKGNVKKLYPNDVQLLNKSVSELCELVQWSDLIIFDYLTANLDRVVNNMFNQQWNSEMMSYPAHNLHKIKDRNTLVFLDNESGLFHGYRLLDKYSKYHEEMLSSLCVFRKQTVREIERLFLEDRIETELYQLLNKNEPQAKNLPQMPEKNMQILKQRFQDVFEQIQKCQRQLTR